MRASSRVLLLLLLPLVAGCETLAYYGQSINGQLDLMRRSRSIDDMLAEPGLSPRLAGRLRLVQRLRGFASDRLGLPDNNSYRSYADVNRGAVVWSVVATPPYDVTPKRWCYPLVGCLAYRGYFAHADATAEAAALRADGLDVAVLPVPAYSTLGWFDDPLPSTVIHWPEPELAGLMFHELAHQQLYIPDDTAFNEAYATTVAEQGVKLWLEQGQEQERYRSWRIRRDRAAQVTALLLAAREQLAEAFANAADDSERAARKAAVYVKLAGVYRRISASWPTPRPYGHWFGEQTDAAGINNAHLAQVATYDHWVPAFRRIWEREGGDAAAFHRAATELDGLPPAERHRRLEALMPLNAGRVAP